MIIQQDLFNLNEIIGLYLSDKVLEENIKKIFLEVFPDLSESMFDMKKKQKDYDNWDSFAQLNLITLAESKFNITLTLDDAISIKSAQDLLECVKSHI